MWKLKIQGTQKNEGKPRSKNILANYVYALCVNKFIYYMRTRLTVRVRQSVLS